ncbi:AraC family transcriptional regulator [Paenibacillus abyssi]|uniref:AraC family transcriptional regulator n=1 Tax=Paenibacillus abyssi TaxID=1340531 RepID=A0A917LDW9_9BACL|nr:AraC family transcriptional regulator [Paenibacillus abyssi]GGG15769.1 AraC family transcriptional regulator [Paenibacillus abyssi]
MSEHFSFSIGLNASPRRGELTPLFSGNGQPVHKHKIGPAVHDYYLVHTVSSGQGRFECAGKQYDCRKGDTFFILPGELFSYEADGLQPWTYHWVAFKGHAAGPLLTSLGISPEQPILHLKDIRKILVLYHHIRQAFQHADNPSMADLEASGWLRLLLTAFGSDQPANLPVSEAKPTDIERQIDQAILWLSLQYEQSISIERIAKALGYHRTHLSKMFKQTTGLSPMQFLYKIRMERAEVLLAGQLTISQIASSVGYPDALYFSKQFRKWKGLSPSEYREQLHHT